MLAAKLTRVNVDCIKEEQISIFLTFRCARSFSPPSAPPHLPIPPFHFFNPSHQLWHILVFVATLIHYFHVLSLFHWREAHLTCPSS